jgi:hypothetical protein
VSRCGSHGQQGSPGPGRRAFGPGQGVTGPRLRMLGGLTRDLYVPRAMNRNSGAAPEGRWLRMRRPDERAAQDLAEINADAGFLLNASPFRLPPQQEHQPRRRRAGFGCLPIPEPDWTR